MSFPRYPKYKDSGMEWIRELPEHWEVMRGRHLFAQLDLPPEPQDRIVTAFRDGQVTLRENRRTEGFTMAILEVGYQHVRKDDLVIHGMDAFAGAIGVSESTGKCTPEYSILTPRREGINNRYFAELLRIMAHRDYIYVICPSVRERAPRFRFESFKDVTLAVPPLCEQLAIIEFLSRETVKIGALLAEQRRLIALLNEEIASLVLRSFKDAGTKEMRLANIVEIISRPVVQQAGETYTRLGLFNRGRGIFRKDANQTDDMGESDFFWIEEGDLILSGQFAWEGAVAIAGTEEAGCVVSHRYPVLRGKPEIVLTEYLLGLFCTKHGDFLLNENSRGAAGRNRPLNISSLLKEKIPVPEPQVQEKIAQAIRAKKALSNELNNQQNLLLERRASLVAAAVTGQIEVRTLLEKEAA